jgi:predicted oxidoreductase
METQQNKSLIYGCMGLGGGWDNNPITINDETAATESIYAAIDAGITTFDHADIYRFGKAEEVFGRVMKNNPSLREKITLQSKAGICLGQGPNNSNVYNLGKEYLLGQIRASLKRLQTDYLDTFLLHRPDVLMNGQEIAEMFRYVKERGMVKSFGVSNMSVAQMQYIRHYCDEPLECNQIQMSLGHTLALDLAVSVNTSLVQSDSGMQGILEYCRIHNIALQAWGALDRGLYTETPLDRLSGKELETATMVLNLSDKYNVSTTAIVVAWLLRIQGSIQPIVGTTKPSRILACTDAQKVPLTKEEWYGLWVTARGATLP